MLYVGLFKGIDRVCFICGLFNDAVSYSKYVALNDGMVNK
jgi:hypothetical protein